MPEISKEAEEVSALRFACNGNGSWPVPKGHLFDGTYDEVVVGIPLEDLTELNIFLRRQFETIKHYKFRISKDFVTETGKAR